MIRLRLIGWGLALFATGAILTAIERWHWNLARSGPIAELSALQASVDTAAKTAKARAAEAEQKTEEKEDADKKAVASMLAAIQADADNRIRDRDARIGRLRNELAAARRRHRDAMPGADANPEAGASGAHDSGTDRGGRPVADSIVDTADGIIERFVAMNRAYQSLVAQAEAGRCIVIEE